MVPAWDQCNRGITHTHTDPFCRKLKFFASQLVHVGTLHKPSRHPPQSTLPPAASGLTRRHHYFNRRCCWVPVVIQSANHRWPVYCVPVVSCSRRRRRCCVVPACRSCSVCSFYPVLPSLTHMKMRGRIFRWGRHCISLSTLVYLFSLLLDVSIFSCYMYLFFSYIVSI